MAYNANWPRWIQASVAKYFKAEADSHGYVSLCEELEERTTEFQESPNRVEIRLDGPRVREASANYYILEVFVNILVMSHMDTVVENAYTGTIMAGHLAAAAANPIPVFRFGNGVEDDGALIGCLVLGRGRDSGVKLFHFGEINKEDRLRQLSIDVAYEMELSTTS